MAELFKKIEVFLPDDLLKWYKKEVQKNISFYPEIKQKAEKEFWSNLDKQPWEVQKQKLWFRFSKDIPLTEEIKIIRKKVWDAEVKFGFGDQFKRILQDIIAPKMAWGMAGRIKERQIETAKKGEFIKKALTE